MQDFLFFTFEAQRTAREKNSVRFFPPRVAEGPFDRVAGSRLPRKVDFPHSDQEAATAAVCHLPGREARFSL